jgi:hypothetical protein
MPTTRRCAVWSMLASVAWLVASADAAAQESAIPPGPSTYEQVELLPLTDGILMLHLDEGHVVHHKRGQARGDETVVIFPLDTTAASKPATYRITSPDDPAYARPVGPARVGRKSKGTDFAWFVDRWENDHAVNDRPDHASEHWIYLALPHPLKAGSNYRLEAPAIGLRMPVVLSYDPARSRSEAVHVNLLGYEPAAARKAAYLFHWMGDAGGLEIRPWDRRAFQVIDQATSRPVFTGKVALRARGDQPETIHTADSPPHGNFLGVDVAECDFSPLTRPGRYRVAVDGIGCSFPFAIQDDVLRPAFQATARALYHNRSGIALEKPFTEYTRPAPHNPKLTPGFAGKLIYTTVRFPEWGSEGGDPKVLLASAVGPVDAAGWYQDAGDWDSYESHLRVPTELLLAYEIAPRNFQDGDLNLPESGNGLPDLIDEAAWLPRFCQRLRRELLDRGYGTGGIGLRIAGDAFGSDEKTLPDGKKVGQGSWEDVERTWVVSGEDPWSTFRYAGTAAHLAFVLRLAGAADPQGIDWTAEAREAYAWAIRNTRPGDDAKGPSLKARRAYAAAALYRLTGEKAFEQQLIFDTVDVTPTTVLNDDDLYPAAVHALGGGPTPPNAPARERLAAAVRHTARFYAVSADRRALRWGGNLYMPMLVGQQTTPLVLPIAVACALDRRSDPDQARRWLTVLQTTADHFLGANALNQTWITGVGPRHPNQVFHMDAWYNGRNGFHPGLIPYGPWRKERDTGQGPWDVAWPHKTLHPPIDAWPGNERWFDNRCSPMNSEFTVHQNSAPAAAIYGILCAPGPLATPPDAAR